MSTKHLYIYTRNNTFGENMRVAIVSRHKDTISLLKTMFDPVYDKIDVFEHIEDPEQLDNYDVIAGNIPLSMFLRTRATHLILVSLNIPRELRGKELSLNELKKYAEFVAIYKNMEFEKWYPEKKAKAVANVDMLLVDDIKLVINEIRIRVEGT